MTQSEFRQRVDAIISCDIEPAEEAWKLLEVSRSTEDVCERLGYTERYLSRLAADSMARRLAIGDKYERLSAVIGPLEVSCWTILLKRCSRATSSHRQQAHHMHRIGMGISDIAKRLGESESTIRALVAASSLTDDRLKEFEVKTGIRLQKIEEPVSISSMGIDAEIRRWALSAHSSGAKISQIAESLGVPESAAKAYVMVALVESGLRQSTVADQFGLSRERVRQLASKAGVGGRESRRAAKLAAEQKTIAIREKVREWVRAHPGCSLEEVAAELKLKRVDKSELPSDVTHLIIDLLPQNYWAPVKYSEEATLAALRQSFEIRNPLSSMYGESSRLSVSGPYYDKLRRSGQIDGPSSERIIQVFGSWTAACKAAGVPSPPAIRAEYTRRWSDEELVGYVAEFLTASSSAAMDSFELWCREEDSRPSPGTVRLQLRLSWSEAKGAALLKLRERWTKLPPTWSDAADVRKGSSKASIWAPSTNRR